MKVPLESATTYPFQTGIVCVPGDDWNTQVASQLEEVLNRGGGAAIGLRVEQVQDGGDVVGQKAVTQRLQDLWGGRKEMR